MAEDGTGGLVYLKRVDGVAHVFVSRYVERPLAGADPGRHRRALRARAGRASARPNGGELIVVWATPFATRRRKAGVRAARRRARPRRHARSGRRSSSTATSKKRPARAPISRSARPGRPTSSTGSSSRSTPAIPLLRPGDVVEQVRVAHFDGAALVEPRRDQPRPGRLDASAHAGQRAADRDRPDRQRRRRLAGAGTSKASRASGPGACSGARSTT